MKLAIISLAFFLGKLHYCFLGVLGRIFLQIIMKFFFFTFASFSKAKGICHFIFYFAYFTKFTLNLFEVVMFVCYDSRSDRGSGGYGAHPAGKRACGHRGPVPHHGPLGWSPPVDAAGWWVPERHC